MVIGGLKEVGVSIAVLVKVAATTTITTNGKSAVNKKTQHYT